MRSAFLETSPEPKSEPRRARPKPLGLRLCAVPVERRIAQAARLLGVAPRQIVGVGRRKTVAGARHVAAWLLRQDGWSFPEIGTHLGGRDHTTIMNSCARIDDERESDPELREVLDGMVRG